MTRETVGTSHAETTGDAEKLFGLATDAHRLTGQKPDRLDAGAAFRKNESIHFSQTQPRIPDAPHLFASLPKRSMKDRGLRSEEPPTEDRSRLEDHLGLVSLP
jgi:hypothetical protein